MIEMIDVDLSVASTFMKPADDIVTRCLQIIGEEIENMQKVSDNAYIQTAKRVREGIIFFIILTIFSLIAGFLIHHFTSRLVLTPLAQLNSAIKKPHPKISLCRLIPVPPMK
jgi:hypothetical protein